MVDRADSFEPGNCDNVLGLLSVKRFKETHSPDRKVKDGAPLINVNQEKEIERLRVTTENARLHSSFISLKRELTDLKSLHILEKDKLLRNNVDLSNSSKSLERLLSDQKEHEKNLKQQVVDLRREIDEERSNSMEKTRKLTCNRLDLEKKYENLEQSTALEIENLYSELTNEKRERIFRESYIEELRIVNENQSNQNDELIKELQEAKQHSAVLKRKNEELLIALKDWRQDNKVAMAMRYDVEELVKIRQENSSIKLQLLKYKNSAENTALLKQEKLSLQEENGRLKKRLEDYTIENSELKTVIAQGLIPSVDNTIEKSNKSNRGVRKSLNDIDVLTSRCVYLKHELDEKCKEVETLQTKLNAVEEYARIFDKNSSLPITDNNNLLPNLEQQQQQLKSKGEKTDHLTSKFNLPPSDYDPNYTNVLHFTNNLMKDAIENREKDLETLKKENSTMRARIQELMRTAAVDKDSIDGLTKCSVFNIESTATTTGCSQSTNVKLILDDQKKIDELEKMQLQIVQLTEQRDRVAKVYKDASLKYREICKDLIGYDVRLQDDESIIVQSIFELAPIAEQKLFKIKKDADGKFALLANGYAKQWVDFVETFLEIDNSYPAFFAAITMRLYQKEDDEKRSRMDVHRR